MVLFWRMWFLDAGDWKRLKKGCTYDLSYKVVWWKCTAHAPITQPLMFRPCIRCEKKYWRCWNDKWCLMSSPRLITYGLDILIWALQLLTVWFTLLFAHSSVLLATGHLQVISRRQRQSFPCTTKLSSQCLWVYLAPIVFHFWLTALLLQDLTHKIGVCHLPAFTSHTYSSWGVSGKGIWLCPSIHSNSCVDHITTALPGRPQGPPAMLTYIPKLPHMVFAAGRLDDIEQMDRVVDVARTSSPWGPARHCCVGELLQPVPEENCGTTHVGAATKGQKLHWLWINDSEQQR